MTRLRNKLEYTNVAYSLMPREFTLRDLQAVYESIYGRSFDKRNFRRRMISQGLIRPTGRTVHARRPPPGGALRVQLPPADDAIGQAAAATGVSFFIRRTMLVTRTQIPAPSQGKKPSALSSGLSARIESMPTVAKTP